MIKIMKRQPFNAKKQQISNGLYRRILQLVESVLKKINATKLEKENHRNYKEEITIQYINQEKT